MGEYIKTLDFDFTIFTGDISSHDTYNYTLAKTAAYTDFFGNWMHTYLAHTPVYPVIGNHAFEFSHSQ